ncbi:hypothetical protein [Wolbachia endosymbiont of Folsomia candida]|uniref:hypothetical protein n=1 Tax=Wolbachia endosymbiont of Folsomia candida TaxID=169402 RepID=UPI00138FF9B7|nr:hypothetical protein [Wolbachia endosymbiont of Folsomia candida]
MSHTGMTKKGKVLLIISNLCVAMQQSPLESIYFFWIPVLSAGMTDGFARSLMAALET